MLHLPRVVLLLQHKLPLRDRCTVERGDYQWPISFQLPPNIPGTFHYNAADHRARCVARALHLPPRTASLSTSTEQRQPAMVERHEVP